MSRWSGRAAAGRTPHTPVAAAEVTPFTVTQVDGIPVLHRGSHPGAQFIEAAVSLQHHVPDGQADVLVAAGPSDGELESFTRALAPAVGELRAKDKRLLRLVMSRGAVDRAAAPSPARRLSDDWGIEVVAAAGQAVVVPDGTLFSPVDSAGTGGWWLFSPAREPTYLGPRFPVPRWSRDLARVTSDIADDHWVQAVPAGLLVQPAGAHPPPPDGLGFSVPVDPHRPHLLVGTAGAPPVSAEALASVLAAVPARVRRNLRLVPADGRDLLALGQEVADALGMEVEVSSGVPVLLSDDAERSRTVLVETDGSPSWEPFVESVVCAPAEEGFAAEVRVGAWRPPAPGLKESAEPGGFLLDQRWQTVPTWTGLWVGRQGDTPPVTARSTAGDVVAIDLGVPGKGLDDSLWPALDRLFASLDEAVRDRAMIQVHGNVGADGLRTLRRLAVRHGMALAPKGWRSAAPDAAPPPALAAPTRGGSGTPPDRQAAPTTDTDALAPVTPPVQYVTTTGQTGPADVPVATATGQAAVVADPQERALSAPGGEATGQASPEAAGAVTGSAAVVEAPPAAAPHAGDWLANVPEPVPPAPAAEEAETSPADPWLPGLAEGTPYDGAQAAAGPAFPGILEWPPPVPPQPDADGGLQEPEPFAPLFTSADTGLGARPDHQPAPRVVVPPRTEDGEDHGEDGDRPAAPDGGGTATGLREIGRVPVVPWHRSTPAERQALRSRLGADWERHASAVQRALTRLPGLRMGADSEEELIADLIAVHAYLGTWDTDTPGDHERDADALARLGCLASGLRRLPSFRGPAVRAASAFDEGSKTLLPGEELGSTGPLTARSVDHGYPAVPDDHYLIWSANGRRVSSLMDVGGQEDPDEVVFGPGTRFRVLAVHERAAATVVLLRETPPNAPPALPGQLDAADLPVLERLTALADRPPAPDTDLTWPPHVTGLLDVYADVPPGPSVA